MLWRDYQNENIWRGRVKILKKEDLKWDDQWLGSDVYAE